VREAAIAVLGDGAASAIARVEKRDAASPILACERFDRSRHSRRIFRRALCVHMRPTAFSSCPFVPVSRGLRSLRVTGGGTVRMARNAKPPPEQRTTVQRGQQPAREPEGHGTSDREKPRMRRSIGA
jgi:hypothetical protein